MKEAIYVIMKEAIFVAIAAPIILAILVGAPSLMGKIFTRIKRMIGTGEDAGRNIGFWISDGILGIIYIVSIVLYILSYAIRLLSEAL